MEQGSISIMAKKLPYSSVTQDICQEDPMETITQHIVFIITSCPYCSVFRDNSRWM